MFYSDMDILVAKERYQEWLQQAAHERLIIKIQHANQQRPSQKIMRWINNLQLKLNPNHLNRLDHEKRRSLESV